MELPLINTQSPLKGDHREDGSLDVFEIFHTIQGEGPFSGRPAVFVRLYGCNLQCPNCDTDYTSKCKRYSPEELFEEVQKFPNTNLVVFTGGEPLRQNISLVVDMLMSEVYDVQIETNGTYYPEEDFDYVPHVVCSPKTPQIHRYYYDINLPFSGNIFYKYVLNHEHVDPEDGLPTSVLGSSIRPARPPKWIESSEIFVQPEDSFDPKINQKNIQKTVEVCMKHGYRISLQLHKILHLP